MDEDAQTYKLVYSEIHNSLLSARRREKQIKGWTIIKKKNLINDVWSKEVKLSL